MLYLRPRSPWFEPYCLFVFLLIFLFVCLFVCVYYESDITTCIKFDISLVVYKLFCYMTPIKDLLWLAETSLHWLWQILMSNSDELKTGNITDRELKINLAQVTLSFVTATWELKIDIATLTDFLCIFHRSNVSIQNLFILWEQHLTHLCRMEFNTYINWNSPFLF